MRCGATLESNPNLIISGSYDHTVRLWDKREHTELFSVNHGSPVEAVLPSPSGSLLFTAGIYMLERPVASLTFCLALPKYVIPNLSTRLLINP